ncbi:MAG: metallophosphoesterase [Candidatus Latescibacteria bacterium]|nr:metallophosphoesterase [Candidatus Latescibacterota bacterium]
MFFLVSFAILALVYGYVGWRMISPFFLGSRWNSLVCFLVLLFLALPFLSLSLRMHGADGRVSDVIAWAGYIGMGFVSLVFVMLVARDAALSAAILFRGTAKALGALAGAPPAGSFDPARRLFILRASNMAILALAGILSLYGIYEAKRTPRVKRVDVPIDDLPDGLEGFRIVQITDVHAGPTLKRRFIERVVSVSNRLDPDVAVLTGDLADGSTAQLHDDVAPLAGLKAKHGVFFVTGNHEYYVGVQQWLEEVRGLGMTTLENEHRVILHNDARVLLAGVNDFDGGHFGGGHRSDPAQACEGAGDADVAVLLAHQPRNVFAAEAAGYNLQISGHTHGGQYIPWNLLIGLQQPYTSGLHRYCGMWLYVSRGTGYWGPPFRIGVPSEITEIVLRKGAAAD